MAQIAWPLRGSNISRDYQFAGFANFTGYAGVRNASALLVSTGSVAAGEALIKCTRTNGEELMLHFRNTAPVTIDTTGTKKVYISVDLAKLDDGSTNPQDGTGIATITTGASYPASNFIPLASISGGVITDERVIVKPTHEAIQENAFITGIDTGTASAYAIVVSPAVSSYKTSQRFCFIATHTSAVNCTVNVCGLGAKTIKKLGGSTNIGAGDILAGQLITVIYDGTNFQLETPLGSSTTVDFGSLTEDTAPDIESDFFLEYDASAGVNKKSKLSNIRATLAEIIAGTSTKKFVSAEGLRNEVKTDYGTTYTAYTIPNRGVIVNSYVNAASYALAAQVTAQKTGKFRISCTLADTTGNSLKMSVQLRVNGSTVQQVDGSYGDPSGFTTDFNDFVINQGDVIAFYVKVIQAQYPNNNETVSFSWATFKYKYYWEGLTYFV